MTLAREQEKVPNNNFTLLRLVLAVMVVLGHFKILSHSGSYAHGIYSYADLAVDAFFVISGYLVYASFDKNPQVPGFYIRRMLRIYPLYFVTVIVQGLAMATVAGGVLEHGRELAHYLFFNLIMANFIAHDLGGLLSGLPNPGINPSLWTLKIEVAFYFMLPLLWYLTRRFGITFWIILYVASTLFAAIALYYGNEVIARQLPGKMRFFVIGFALYYYRDSLKISLPAAIATVIITFALCSLRFELWFLPVYPLCVGIIVFICALRLPALPLSFDISYGIYLFHGPFIQFALLLGVFQETPGFLLLLLSIVCLLALVAERMIERPFIALGHRLSSSRKGMQT